MHPVIAIIDDYEGFVTGLDAYSMLRTALPYADIRVVTQQPLNEQGIKALQDVEYLVLIRERTCITAALLDQLPALKAIVQTGTIGAPATSHIDVAACAERGVEIMEGLASDGHSAAEITWALILNASRNIYPYMTSMAAGTWHQGVNESRLGLSLRGRTLGVLGYGRIGQLLGQYAKAFGMEVLVWGRESTRAAAQANNVRVSKSRDDLFSSSDILAIQLRLNGDTLHSVRRQDLSLMKQTSLLVCASRAALIEPGALLEGLQSGRPGMAAIDVYDTEPQLSINALMALPNCIGTPHIGYVERNSYDILFTSTFKKLIDNIQS